MIKILRKDFVRVILKFLINMQNFQILINFLDLFNFGIFTNYQIKIIF